MYLCLKNIFSSSPFSGLLLSGYEEDHFSQLHKATTSLLIAVQKVLMAHTMTDGKLCIPPFPLALALIILKSKPIEYSPRGENFFTTHFTSLDNSWQLLEYIDKIRQQCRACKRNINDETSHQSSNAVVHWRELFLDSQVEILNLHRKLQQLEHEVETLKSTSRVIRVSGSSTISESKQKRASSDEPSEARSKRTKVSSGSINTNWSSLQRHWGVFSSPWNFWLR